MPEIPIDNLIVHDSDEMNERPEPMRALCDPYRDDYYFKDSEQKGVAEIIVAKQRNGPTGTVLTKFTASCTRFDNLEAEELGVDQFDDFVPG